MILAIRNLLFDRVRLLLAIAGVAFAVFLMVFQGSLLQGFSRAASNVIDSTSGDIWIAARGVPCFDFPNPIRSSIGSMAYGVAGVRNVHRVVSGLQFWQRPSGSQKTVVVVGVEGGGLQTPESVMVDESDLATLEVRAVPVEIEIGQQRAHVSGTIRGFASFIGSPYVFAPYDEASKYLHLGDERTMFLVVEIARGYSAGDVRRELAGRFPEADVWLASEFSARARNYWILQTGAGGALLTAALLGFLVGAVIVSQTMYGMTMENLEEFATLKAIGASSWFITRIVLWQAVLAGVAGTMVGIALSFPAVSAAKAVVGWIYTPWWLPGWIAGASLIMCCLASIASIRTALEVEPARVFRA
jgi:putative ABC transport system permease protein